MAAPAYSYRSTARQQQARRQPERSPRVDVRTVRGARQQASVSVLSAPVRTMAIAVAAVIIVVALFSLARIFVSSQAIVTTMSSEDITAEISRARSAGSTLEVQSSAMGNASTVKEKAEKLGMFAPGDVTYITLPEDVVVVGEDGSLSLVDSIAKASSAVAGA